MVALNGEIPPAPKDKAEAEFYEQRGIIILDEYSAFLGSVFFRVLEAGQYQMRLNQSILRSYCQRYELDFIDTYEMFSPMLTSLNKTLSKKIKDGL